MSCSVDLSLERVYRQSLEAIMPLANDHPASNGSDKSPNEKYDSHHRRFASAGLPTDEAGWLSRAADVAAIFAIDAAQRDIDNISPFPEVALLKSSNLTKVMGPRQYGGGGQGWDVAYKVIREVAKGDG